MVVVVVAVSKASSGRAWQSSSSCLSIYEYTILRKKEFVLVSFFGVFLVNFFLGERFFFLFFLYFFRQKHNEHTFDETDTHYKKLPLPKFMRVCLRVSVV